MMKVAVTLVMGLLGTARCMPQVGMRNNLCSSAVCEDNSVADFVSMLPDLSTLATAVNAAELAEALGAQDKKFTVFAPVNKAFEAVEDLDALVADKELLTATLLRHVVGDEIQSGQIPEGETVVTSLGEDEVTVTRSGTTVTVSTSGGDAGVVIADILANNGVIHLIDGVV